MKHFLNQHFTLAQASDIKRCSMCLEILQNGKKESEDVVSGHSVPDDSSLDVICVNSRD